VNKVQVIQSKIQSVNPSTVFRTTAYWKATIHRQFAHPEKQICKVCSNGSNVDRRFVNKGGTVTVDLLRRETLHVTSRTQEKKLTYSLEVYCL